MNEPTTSPWPQTPDGVTDWDRVFEDPHGGFIALIVSAHSPETLKDCATVIVQQLFSRDNDSMTIMKFIIDLDRILPESDGQSFTPEEVSDMRDAVADFLRRIKDDRIHMAQKYLRKKNKDAERRST